jgi:hypothetical protein
MVDLKAIDCTTSNALATKYIDCLLTPTRIAISEPFTALINIPVHRQVNSTAV